MALTNIDRDAVLAAISECDALGREGFLESYGFAPAREYILRHNGREYDSKAIVGVAHRYARPDLGALRAQEFSGGEATVGRLLRRLGFDVVPAEQEDRATWIFQANPQLYDTLAMLRDEPNQIHEWKVSRYAKEIVPGDRMLLWVAGPEAAIHAVCTIVSDVYEIEPPDEFGAVKVDFQVDSILDEPVRRDELIEQPDLGDLDILRFPQATNFRVTQTQWEALERLLAERASRPVPPPLGDRPGDEPAEVALAVEMSERLARGRAQPRQGFRPNAAQRRAIELRAMDVVTDHLEAEGYLVDDVSARESFDLLAAAEGRPLFEVEVKGTTSDGSSVLLTRAEVERAQHRDEAALAVVSGIRLAGDDQAPSATHGALAWYYPWSPAPEDLTPISFQYDVPDG